MRLYCNFFFCLFFIFFFVVVFVFCLREGSGGMHISHVVCLVNFRLHLRSTVKNSLNHLFIPFGNVNIVCWPLTLFGKKLS